MEANLILVIILAISILGKANSVAVGVAILLVLKLLNLDKYVFPVLNDKGVFWALVVLIATILIPIANGQITVTNIRGNLLSWVGVVALILSFLTTYLSGLGLQYLTVKGNGDVMPALIIGSVAAAAFLKGVPVGPLITSGMLAVVVKLVHKN